MLASELKNLVMEIGTLKTEKQNVELKTAFDGCPKRLYGTLSSFANQDCGGIIIFGIDEKNGYNLCGVYDAQDLQKKVTEQCLQMEPEIRVLFTVCSIDNKLVVSAEIPGAAMALRPVFYKGAGRLKGSYIRVGEADEPMTEYEVYSYMAFRQRISEDLRVEARASLQSFNQRKLQDFLTKVKLNRKNLMSNVQDQDILELMGVCQKGQPTLAGIISMGDYPQAFFPQLSITAVRVPGLQMGDAENEEVRFTDNVRLCGTIEEMLKGAMEFVERNIKVRTVIDKRGQRFDEPEYPLVAVREAVLNALAHRDYSVYTEGVPVRIEIYNDRLEVINSGGLYGSISIDSLGKVRPQTRNQVLVNILELLSITENRYSGIPTMFRECRKAGLAMPVFETCHGEFKVIFKNARIADNFEKNDWQKIIWEFCREPRTKTEIMEHTKLSAYYVTKELNSLLQAGLLDITMKEVVKSKNRRYFALEK